MQLDNVLIATKQTSLEYYKQKYDDIRQVLSHEQLERKIKEHKEHYDSFNYIKSVLEKNKIAYQRVYIPYASYEDFKDKSLIISVGGDGTVLNTAHYMNNGTPLLTVKSEKDSVGAMCQIKATNFDEALDKIIKDDFSIEQYNRVEGKFGNRTDIALNEIAIGPKYFSGTARYKLNFREFNEEQRSSKIIISTGAGSSAWYKNIANSDGLLSPSSMNLKFIVSEAINAQKYKLLKGTILQDEHLEITSLMDVDGCISFDGDTNKRLYDFAFSSKINIRLSTKPLEIITFGSKKI